MRTEIRIAGTGGQGAITVGQILGTAAALHDKKDAVVTEGYSPSITGGWSRADVVISDEPIDYPLVTRLDALVAMYQGGLDLNAKIVKPSAAVVVESQLVDATRAKTEGEAFPIPAAAQAQTLGKKVLTNIILLGALLELTPVVSRDSVESTLAGRFPAFAELNIKALNCGFELARAAVAKRGRTSAVAQGQR
ncbi:MAG TPA: 2-oxoacid:acceptor oxidoreductase family protein [Nitrososphaerales archaeon]|nr:2-oxoacid:acceptor oxidoreductase family protein [Nitrososphaerales archaeon]